MRRVVITGMGIRSCIGNELDHVKDSLQHGRSGITRNASFIDVGMKSQVSGTAATDFDTIDRKLKRFMSVAACYGYQAACSALAHARLTPDAIAHCPRYGIVAGSGGNSTGAVVEAAEILRTQGARRIGPYFVTRTMSNTVTANVGTALKIQGIAHSISSACATSADAIGYAYQMIQWGKQDLMLAGGAEEDHWTQAIMFDGMGALSSKYNDVPATASRPYAKSRDGFVMAGGAGFLVLESLEHALERGVPIIAELVGYAANSDGADMVAPSGEGAQRCIQMALQEAQQHGVNAIDYINTHGTSTPAGDIAELRAIQAAFGNNAVPPLSSTKSMTGHSLGAAGVHEAIYCLLMMQNNFIAPSVNIDELDEAARGFDIVQQTRYTPVNVTMSNSFGFGGVNACLIFRKFAS